MPGRVPLNRENNFCFLYLRHALCYFLINGQTMGVRIEVPPFLLHLTKGLKVAEVNGNTVGECLHELVKQFPGTEKLLFDRDGKLIGHIDLFLNGVSTFPEELAKPVSDGDTISMLYLIIGG
jgi:molybdopterin converting factor small subunit